MQGFTLLTDEILFKKIITPDPNGQLVNGIWFGGDPVISYEELEGIWEPYQKGQDNVVLPEGVTSSDALVLFSEAELLTHSDLVGNTNKADIVYVEDPEVDPTAKAYVVWYKAPWIGNGGFELLMGHGEYVLVRQEKL